MGREETRFIAEKRMRERIGAEMDGEEGVVF